MHRAHARRIRPRHAIRRRTVPADSAGAGCGVRGGRNGVPAGLYRSNGGYVLEGRAPWRTTPGTAAGQFQPVKSRLFLHHGNLSEARSRFHRSRPDWQRFRRDHQRGACAPEFPESRSHRPAAAVRPGHRKHAVDDHRRRGRKRSAGFAGVTDVAGAVHASGAAPLSCQRSAGRHSHTGRSFVGDCPRSSRSFAR